MRLDKGLEIIELMNTLGNRDKFNLTLVYDKQNTILFDAGNPGSLQYIKSAFFNMPIEFESISKIIVTHQDMGHIGGINGVKEELTDNSIEVMAHQNAVEYMDGTTTPLKMTPDFIKKLNAMIKLHSFKKQQEMNKILDNYQIKVDKVLADNEELPYCGGIKVIHTPGHTPDHTCFYLKKYKTLIAGDALSIENGELYGPDAHAALDLKTAIDSLNKLTELNIKKVICYHGGVYDKNVTKRIKTIIESELNELKHRG